MISGDEIRSRTKDPKGAKQDTLNAPYFEGIVDGGERQRSTQLVKFIFNQRKKGWNYAWQASKHTAKARHAFFAYLFVEERNDWFRCVGLYISPTFILYCRKRKAELNNSGIKRRKAELANEDFEEEDEFDETDLMLDQGGMNFMVGGMDPNGMLMMSGDMNAGGPLMNFDHEPLPFSQPVLKFESIGNHHALHYPHSANNNNNYHNNTTQYQHLSNTTGGNLTPFTASLFKNIMDTPNGPSRGGTSNIREGQGGNNNNNNNANGTPSSYSGDEDDIDFETANEIDPTTSRRIASVLDRIYTNLSQDGTAESLKLPQFALDEFLNDLDLAAESFEQIIHGGDPLISNGSSNSLTRLIDPISSSSSSSAAANNNSSSSRSSSNNNSHSNSSNNNKGPPPPSSSSFSNEFEPLEWTNHTAQEYQEIIHQLGNYLLEESSVTASIRQIIAQDQEGKFKGSPDRRLHAFVILFQRELNNFLTKKGFSEKQLDDALRATSVDGTDTDAARTLDVLDQHVSRVVGNQRKISEKKQTLSWMNVVNPEIDLTGHWRVDDTLIAAFEECRAKRGIPYMMRRLLSYMESQIVITHTVDRVVIGLISKLFASQEVEYILDGVERAWDVAPPVPFPRKLCETYVASLEGDAIHYAHVYDGMTRTARIVRKNASGDRLEMEVLYQEKTAGKWGTVFSRKGYLLKVNPITF